MSARVAPVVEKEERVVLVRDLRFKEGHFVELREDGTPKKLAIARKVDFEDHTSPSNIPATLDEAIKRIEELELNERTLKRQVDEMVRVAQRQDWESTSTLTKLLID